MIGEDLFGDSVEAAELATSLGGAYGAEVLLVRSAPLRQTRRKPRYSKGHWADVEARADNGAPSELEVKIGMALGRRLETRITVGDAATSVLEVVAEREVPALVAVGGGALGVLERFGIGGIPSRLLRAAKGPVLIHRHPPPEGGT